jgi:hypothetical protein
VQENQSAERFGIPAKVDKGAKMRNALSSGGVGHTHRRFEDGKPLPPRPNKDFHLELKSPGSNTQPERLRQWI